jgi:isopentenyldiphosphate isomerase
LYLEQGERKFSLSSDLIREILKEMAERGIIADLFPNGGDGFNYNHEFHNVIKEDRDGNPVFDSDGNPIWEDFVRLNSFVHTDKNGCWHAVTRVLLIDKETGKIILSKKSYGAGVWDVSVGGHLGTGVNFEEKTVRETKEELGINIKESNLIKIAQNLLSIGIPNPQGAGYKDGIFYYKTNEPVYNYEASNWYICFVSKDEIEEILSYIESDHDGREVSEVILLDPDTLKSLIENKPEEVDDSLKQIFYNRETWRKIIGMIEGSPQN